MPQLSVFDRSLPGRDRKKNQSRWVHYAAVSWMIAWKICKVNESAFLARKSQDITTPPKSGEPAPKPQNPVPYAVSGDEPQGHVGS